MKKISLLAVALTPFIGASVVSAQGVATDPVGYVTTQLGSGLTSVGVNMVKPAAFAAGVESADSSSVSVANAPDFASLLSADGSYYLEVRTGGLEGDRIDVDVAATRASVDGTIHLDTAAGHNTLSSAAGIEVGVSVLIRPHVTLADITEMIGADAIFSGGDVGDTDQILTFEGGAFRVHAYFDGVWYDAATFAEVDDKVLPAGSGFLFRHRGSGAALTALGEVRMNDFVLPLVEGLQMVSFGYPVDASPQDYVMTTDYFTGAELDIAEGDQILLFVEGAFRTYALFNDNRWYAAADFSDVTETDLFSADGAALLRRHEADPDFRLIRPF